MVVEVRKNEGEGAKGKEVRFRGAFEVELFRKEAWAFETAGLGFQQVFRVEMLITFQQENEERKGVRSLEKGRPDIYEPHTPSSALGVSLCSGGSNNGFRNRRRKKEGKGKNRAHNLERTTDRAQQRVSGCRYDSYPLFSHSQISEIILTS